MPVFRKDKNGGRERQCCIWSKIVSCSLQTLIINIKRENQKPLIRPKIQLLQLRNSSPILDTESCSYRYIGTQNTPMLHSCLVEENLSNREQTFSFDRSSGTTFLTTNRKGNLYVPLSYSSYLFQQLIRVGKKIMNTGNTRNTVINLAVDTDVTYLSTISFPFANSLVPEHLALAKRLVTRVPFCTKTFSYTEIDTFKHQLYTRGTSIPLIYILPGNSVWLFKPETKQMRFCF